MTPEWLKANMGGWPRCTPRTVQETEMPQWPLPVADRQVRDADSHEDGTGIWLPAGVIGVHDEVDVAGEWLTVTGTVISAPDYEQPGSAVLDVAGRSLWLDYTARVYARDAAAVIGSEIGGAR